MFGCYHSSGGSLMLEPGQYRTVRSSQTFVEPSLGDALAEETFGLEYEELRSYSYGLMKTVVEMLKQAQVMGCERINWYLEYPSGTPSPCTIVVVGRILVESED